MFQQSHYLVRPECAYEMKGLKQFLAIGFFVSLVYANAPDQTIKKAFDAFIVQHSKSYGPNDYVKRFTQFVKVYKFVLL